MNAAHVELLGRLTESLAALFDAALLVEPAGGVNDAWAQVLARYGVPPVDERTRAETRARLDLARGALPAEVAACALAIANQFAHAVGDPRLVEAAAATWRAIEPTYLAHATWRPKSMFAFAVQTAKQAANKGWQRPPGGYVLRCPHCGGPRLSADTTTCQFCGQELLPR